MVDSPTPHSQAANSPPNPVLTPNQRLEMLIRVAERYHDDEAEFGVNANAAAIKSAEEAIKAAILVNGGSSVAMLAFIGTLASRDVLSFEQLSAITRPLLWFGSGVGAAVVASAAAYFVNLFIANMSAHRHRDYEPPFIRLTLASNRYLRIGEGFRWLGILAMTASIACFIVGLVTAKAAFKNVGPAKSPIVAPTAQRFSCFGQRYWTIRSKCRTI